MEEQFGTETIINDLLSQSIIYYFIELESRPIGFVKINLAVNTDDLAACCELEKMYLLPGITGKGYGKKSLNKILEEMQKLNKEWIILEVLDSNKQAINFYQRLGFRSYDSKQVPYPLFKKQLNGLNLMVLHL